ncbi:MAG TPA: pseudouridine synthase, partial [Burkholderiales bacterium]|nr:pseudouridine synthase [Burkholderiales bacterium]
HQIRVHLHSVGHPLVGDPVYRLNNRSTTLPPEVLDFPRQALHAARLALVHPQTGQTLTWQAPAPPDIVHLLWILRNA